MGMTRDGRGWRYQRRGLSDYLHPRLQRTSVEWQEIGKEMMREGLRI